MSPNRSVEGGSPESQKWIASSNSNISSLTLVGNVIPLSQVRNDVATAYKKEVECQTNQMLLPLKKMCEQRKVHVDVVVIESDDVATAVAEEVAKGATTKLVVGASSSGIFKSFEWWSFEVLTLLAGLLHNPQLETSVLSVCLNTTTLHYFIPYGVGASASTRVSNELGAGNPKAAKSVVRVVVILGVAEAIIVFGREKKFRESKTEIREVQNVII